MSNDELLSKLGNKIDIVNFDISHHASTFLRSWAEKIDAGDLSVQQAIIIWDVNRETQTLQVISEPTMK